MFRISVVATVISMAGLIVVTQGSSAASEQTPSILVGQGIPRCEIPKQFGRLVTFIPGADTGLAGHVTSQSANGNVLAGQAIFEAQDGTIRWVAIVAPAKAASDGRPVIRVMPRNFPVLPIYECALGHVWPRP